MALRNAHFRGKLKLKGRPKEQARAEIMLMNAEYRLKQKKRRMILFSILDLILVSSLFLAIYSFYQGNILNGLLTLLAGTIILAYFLIRRYLKNKSKRH